MPPAAPAPAHRPPRDAAVAAVIALGGAVGAVARYGVGLALPHRPDQFPWGTFGVNVSGCLLIGVLMVVVLELRRPHPLVRPLLGTGVLGGYTTFSTYAVETRGLLAAGRPAPALAYLLGSVAVGLAATWLAMLVTRRAAGTRPAAAA